MKDNTCQKNIVDLINMPLLQLISLANKSRKDFIGQSLDLCSIINAKSGLCNEDCKFCAQSLKHKAKIEQYPLITQSQILDAAYQAKKIGAKRFGIVTSGNKLNSKEIEALISVVKKIKDEFSLLVCGSLGALSKDALAGLKEAGLSRYHHNIETSENFYPKIVSTHSFKERISTIMAAKEVGLEVCSGGIIGLGESWQDRLDMACTLKDLEVDSIPINVLVPIAGTPLEGFNIISCNDVIRTIAIFRIILNDKTIKVAAGRETVLKDFQAMAFMAGANGMIIGGYLTIKGREVSQDHHLIEEIKLLWKD